MTRTLLHLCVVLGLVSLPVTAFGRTRPRQDDPTWARRAWLERASRALRYGAPLSRAERSSAWLTLPESAVVDQMMTDPRFGDTLLDFNLGFLGYRFDRLKDDRGTYIPDLFDIPSAVHSARNAVTGGDYLALLDLKQPMYVGALGVAQPYLPGEDQMTPVELRDHILGAHRKHLGELLAKYATVTEPKTVNELCDDWRGMFWFQKPYFSLAGQNSSLYMHSFTLPGVWMRFMDACIYEFQDPRKDGLDLLRTAGAAHYRMLDALDALKPDRYLPKTLSEVRAWDLEKLWGEGGKGRIGFFANALRNDLVNSSTNFNRKRAAYFLSRFFCDDLAPLRVEDPKVHAADGHLSDPACMACHYKLDPMAGFFRDFGNFFNDYSDSEGLLFEDNSVVPLAGYAARWKAAPASGRKWEVGYVRSTRFLEQNSYGESIEDLFKILREAPEVRACIAKRATQYVLGDQQTVDPAYLEDLAGRFGRESGADSTAAIRALFRRLVLSRAFAAQPRDPAVCYDQPAGAAASADRPPCAVASILDKNCTSCHRSTAGPGGLDLSRWRAGFPHVGADGAAVPPKTTLQRIQERLISGDPDKRMPLGQFIPSADREALFKWLETQL